ncbi:MAG: helix-turn-helix domain-containing protein [Lachnospiraceae bacterium]|nr:helix-turn-helix domain-containing protein [Lachnospiraceae bacterium]
MDNQNNETIGMNIRRLRKEHNWTQKDIEDRIHIQRETISKYEKNILTPTSDNLRLLEELFKVPSGTLAKKVSIVIPDTSALMRNKRLLNLLLEDYSQIVIPDVVITELSGYKNIRINYHSTVQERRQKKIASQTMSMIDEYMLRHRGKIVKKDTRNYDVSHCYGVSEKDQRIIELAKAVRKESSRVVEIIHVDKDFPLLTDESITTIYLENYMAKRSKTETNYQMILDLDMEYDHLERYDMAARQMDLDAYLPDGMTLLISCIRCNEPEKIEERGGRHIPEPKIQKKMLFLLEHGADPNKTDCHQYCHTPLEHCIERHDANYDEFCILLEHGADYNKVSVDETQPGDKRISEINEGNTPLMIASYLGNVKWVKKLCSMPNISINAQDCNGYTALIKCAVSRWNKKNEGKKYDYYEEIYRFLRDEMHADTLIRDRNNRTAQDWWNRPTEEEEND